MLVEDTAPWVRDKKAVDYQIYIALHIHQVPPRNTKGKWNGGICLSWQTHFMKSKHKASLLPLSLRDWRRPKKWSELRVVRALHLGILSKYSKFLLNVMDIFWEITTLSKSTYNETNFTISKLILKGVKFPWHIPGHKTAPNFYIKTHF